MCWVAARRRGFLFSCHFLALVGAGNRVLCLGSLWWRGKQTTTRPRHTTRPRFPSCPLPSVFFLSSVVVFPLSLRVCCSCLLCIKRGQGKEEGEEEKREETCSASPFSHSPHAPLLVSPSGVVAVVLTYSRHKRGLPVSLPPPCRKNSNVYILKIIPLSTLQSTSYIIKRPT